ncbi:MAG: flavodoxin family protein [Oleiphilaceae bacterium]|nr:flavodoxin family protein [Oleiphilaceae bacterium]
MDKHLLIIAHALSPNTQTLLKTINDASNKSQCIVTSLSAFDTTPERIIQADAVNLFTPENLSYISGAMKDMFDRCYYPLLEKKQGFPVAAIVRAEHDGTDTVHALPTLQLP